MHWQFVNLGASKIADLSMEWGWLWDNIGAVCIVGILGFLPGHLEWLCSNLASFLLTGEIFLTWDGLPTNSETLSSFSLHFLVVVVFIKMPL